MDLLVALVHLLEAPRVPFIVPRGLGAVGASFGSSQPSLPMGAPDCPVRHRTVHSNTSDWQFPSLKGLAVGAPDELLFNVLCAPGMLLFIVLCTGQVTIHRHMHRTVYYSLSCAPDMLLFTILCIEHVTIHYPMHWTFTIYYPVYQPTAH
jgi:hypothetical protein